MAKTQAKEKQPVKVAPPPPARKGERARTPAVVTSAVRAAETATPFAAMRRMMQEMARLFDDVPASLLPRLAFLRPEAAWAPTLEVAERGGRLVVRAELPGLSKDDIKVEVREEALAIQGERRQEREEKGKGFFRSERSYGSFYREIPLPEGVDPESVKATFKNGLLEVTMPAPVRKTGGRSVPIASE